MGSTLPSAKCCAQASTLLEMIVRRRGLISGTNGSGYLSSFSLGLAGVGRSSRRGGRTTTPCGLMAHSGSRRRLPTPPPARAPCRVSRTRRNSHYPCSDFGKQVRTACRRPAASSARGTLTAPCAATSAFDEEQSSRCRMWPS
jgi:hypothetical protein